MSIPDPQLGLVLSYSYLWHHEHRAGREEGVKNRPCVIVFALLHPDGVNTIVRVAPVTHSPPDNPAMAFELPATVKRHLGLDAERSRVILDEVNEFGWPGFDLQPVPRAPDSFAYGFLPPRLFEQLSGTKGQGIPRDRDCVRVSVVSYGNSRPLISLVPSGAPKVLSFALPSPAFGPNLDMAVVPKVPILRARTIYRILAPNLISRATARPAQRLPKQDQSVDASPRTQLQTSILSMARRNAIGVGRIVIRVGAAV